MMKFGTIHNKTIWSWIGYHIGTWYATKKTEQATVARRRWRHSRLAFDGNNHPLDKFSKWRLCTRVKMAII